MKINLFLKRVVAYFIDYLVILILTAGLVYLSFINPRYEEYKDVSNKYNNIVMDYYDKKINIEELNKKTQAISYDLNKNGYVYLVGDIIIALLYFGGFAYWTKGQTLGKKIMKVKIVKAKDKDLKLHNYLIRAFILNGIILNIIILVALCFKDQYLTICNYGSNFTRMLELIILVCILMNSEGRGLHDFVAKTKVIDLKEEESKEIEVKEEVIKKEKKNNEKRSSNNK